MFENIWLEPGEKPLPAMLKHVTEYDHERQAAGSKAAV
jgi:hypothetical protein